jgi:hypothetical protein
MKVRKCSECGVVIEADLFVYKGIFIQGNSKKALAAGPLVG